LITVEGYDQLVEAPDGRHPLRDQESVRHHGAPHAELSHRLDQLVDVIAEQRFPTEELDADRPQASELGQDPAMLVDRELGILAVGTVAIDAPGIAAVEERILHEERSGLAGQPGSEDLRADEELVCRLHMRVSTRSGNMREGIFG